MSFVLCRNGGSHVEGVGEGSCCAQERGRENEREGWRLTRGPKRKADGKDSRPSKKVTITPGDKLPKKPSPPKLSHGAGKRLMTTSSPISQGPDHHLLTQKDYGVEMIESIIKDKDVDPCAEQMMEELGVSGLFTFPEYVSSFSLSHFYLFTI